MLIHKEKKWLTAIREAEMMILKRRPRTKLSVSVEMESVPKLPHERDESVDSQVGGPRPGRQIQIQRWR